MEFLTISISLEQVFQLLTKKKKNYRNYKSVIKKDVESRVQRERARICEWKAVMLLTNLADGEFKHGWVLKTSCSKILSLSTEKSPWFSGGSACLINKKSRLDGAIAPRSQGLRDFPCRSCLPRSPALPLPYLTLSPGKGTCNPIGALPEPGG